MRNQGSELTNALLFYCRPGFEEDVFAEILDVLQLKTLSGKFRAEANSGFVVVEMPERAPADLKAKLSYEHLIFARQVLSGVTGPIALPVADRVTLIAERVAQYLPGTASDMLSGFYLEHPDTEKGKSLSSFCQSLAGPLMTALKKRRFLWEKGAGPKGAPRLNVFFLSKNEAYVGFCDPKNSSPYPSGIPRLKFRQGSPSRSSLKLEEALSVFLGDRQAQLFSGDRTAVDLGAAPGGWTFELSRRGMRVIAVDNASVDPDLLASGRVSHVRANAFDYNPSRKVDWLCCDVVDRPSLVTRLVGRWLAEGFARHALFNLKLPMRQRYPEIKKCLVELEQTLILAAEPYRVRCKHLYHDRKEVTVFVEPAWRGEARKA